MKVLITGGAGFLGRRLAKRLLQKGVLKNAEGEEEKIDQLVVGLVRRQHEKAVQLLTNDREKLDQLAAYLYEKETITGEEFMHILNG